MKVQVLGTCCPKCKRLEELVREIVADLGLEHEVEKVSDIKDIMAFGVMATPALVIDGKVRVSGKVPTTAELKEMLRG